MKLLSAFQRALSYTPLAWILLFISFVLRTYLKIGRLPKYSNPDPGYLGFEIHYGFLIFSLFIIFFTAFLWLPLTIFLGIKKKQNLYMIDVVIYILFYLIVCNIGRIDPWGLSTWFAD